MEKMKHEKTRYKDIYKHLVTSGFDVYTPGQKEGECTSPYLVVKDAGTEKYNTYSSTQTVYDVMCYVPKKHFTDLEQYVQKMKLAMDKLRPMIMPLYSETGSFYDDTVNAHMISVQYRNMRKIY